MTEIRFVNSPATCENRTMRQARGGVLVVGGGFAGGYVARLLGKHGATIVSPENFMLYTPLLPEAASGTLEPRHTVVPLRQMCPHAELRAGTRHLARRRAEDGRRRDARRRRVRDRVRATRDWRSARCRAPSRFLAWPSTGSASRTSPTRSACATGSCASSKRPTPRSTRSSRSATSASSSSAPATQASRRSPSCPTSYATHSAGTRACATLPQRWLLVDAAPKILPEIPTRLGDYAAKGARRPRCRDPRLDDAGLVRRRRGRALERRTDPSTHARAGRQA